MAGTDAITDFNQFAGLRAQARQNDAATIHKVAQQFEALFTQQLMKGMRSGALGSDVMGGGQTEFYQDIVDQQMAVHLSSGKGMGLADLLVKQLRGRQAGADKTTTTNAAQSLPLKASAHWMPLNKAVSVADPQQVETTAVGSSATTADAKASLSPLALQRVAQLWARATAPANDTSTSASSITSDAGVTSPSVNSSVSRAGSDEPAADAAQFVKELRPHAERAARELGVPSELLMAQAALETGWGRHSVRDASGTPSFNFFGIKADKHWQGSSVQTMTSEYSQGAVSQEAAQFRSYDSPSAAFDDYVDFLKSNPRYAQTLRSGSNPAAFAYGLQQAGYATDPAYAQKLLKVAYGPTMRAALAQTPRQYAL